LKPHYEPEVVEDEKPKDPTQITRLKELPLIQNLYYAIKQTGSRGASGTVRIIISLKWNKKQINK
jgi:hypothetical protein